MNCVLGSYWPEEVHGLPTHKKLIGCYWMCWLGLAETVIYRIFFYVNKAGNGQLQLREIKRSNLIAALQQVDEEEDINKVLRWVILPCSLSGHLSRWMHVRVTNLLFCVFLLPLSWQSQNRMYCSYTEAWQISILVMTGTFHMSTSTLFTASSGNSIQIMTFWLIRMTSCGMGTML